MLLTVFPPLGRDRAGKEAQEILYSVKLRKGIRNSEFGWLLQ
jgi:hypothetical protein